MLERLGTRVQTLHKLYAEKKEKEIVFGGSSKWQDVEADEATFARTAQAGKGRNVPCGSNGLAWCSEGSLGLYS